MFEPYLLPGFRVESSILQYSFFPCKIAKSSICYLCYSEPFRKFRETNYSPLTSLCKPFIFETLIVCKSTTSGSKFIRVRNWILRVIISYFPLN